MTTNKQGSNTTALEHSDVELSERHSLTADQIQSLADGQEAETVLFQYITSSASQLETPPFILKKLAASLGDPQQLPATQILRAAIDTPLAHPLATLISMDGILHGELADLPNGSSDRLPGYSPNTGGENTCKENADDPAMACQWISVHYQDRSNEMIRQHPEMFSGITAAGLPETNPAKFFPITRVIFFVLVAVYLLVAFKAGSLSPFAISEMLRSQQARTEQPDMASQPAQPAAATLPVTPQAVEAANTSAMQPEKRDHQASNQSPTDNPVAGTNIFDASSNKKFHNSAPHSEK